MSYAFDLDGAEPGRELAPRSSPTTTARVEILEREKVWHGLDPRLYPAVKYVDVTHLTASPGSMPITVR